LMKIIINNFFLVGGGGFVIYIGVNPHWESGTAAITVYGGDLCFSSSLLLSKEPPPPPPRGRCEPGTGRHANQ
jgi:hypothetical protein